MRYAGLFPTTTKVIDSPKLYECGICSCYHPVGFDGDCREDVNRFGDPEEYEKIVGHSVEVIPMEDLDV